MLLVSIVTKTSFHCCHRCMAHRWVVVVPSLSFTSFSQCAFMCVHRPASEALFPTGFHSSLLLFGFAILAQQTIYLCAMWIVNGNEMSFFYRLGHIFFVSSAQQCECESRASVKSLFSVDFRYLRRTSASTTIGRNTFRTSEVLTIAGRKKRISRLVSIAQMLSLFMFGQK